MSKNVWRNKQNDRGAEVREMFKKFNAVSLEIEKIRREETSGEENIKERACQNEE